jgi:hypothetical protein
MLTANMGVGGGDDQEVRVRLRDAIGNRHRGAGTPRPES